MTLTHGQIWWADLDKVRPALVLTRGNVAPLMRRIVVAPITTRSRGLATEVSLGRDQGLDQACVANLDNVQLVDVERLLGQIGAIGAERWPEVCEALARSIGC